MNIIFLILPLTLVLCVVAIVAFVWATRSGQFDDLETPAIRVLHDEDATASRQTEAVLSRDPIDPDRLPR
jgi:cbb3-type cytochrome oxidase maturation protein